MPARPIPFVPQMEAVECGAACLTMVLRFFGHHAELSALRDACGVSRDGVSAKSVVRVAREFGLTAKARRLEPEDLAAVTDPAVLHWEMNHFVVLQRWTPEGVDLVDPAVGPRRVSAAEFDKSFTGICIELSPGEAFRQKAPERRSRERFRRLFEAARAPLVALLLGSLALNLLGLGLPLVTRVAVDRVLGGGQDWLAGLALGGAGALLLQAGLALARARLLARLRRWMDARVGAALVGHLLALPLRFFQQRRTADLVGRAQSTRALREIVTGQGLTLLVDGVFLVGSLVLLLALSPLLGAVVVGAGALIVGLMLATRPAQRARLRARLIHEIKEQNQLLQTVQGLPTIKASGREYAAHGRWLQRLTHALDAGVEEERLAVRLSTAVRLLGLAAPAATLLLGAQRVAHGSLTVGELMGFQMLAFAFLGPLERTVLAALRLEELPLILGRMDDVLAEAPEPSGVRHCPPLRGHLEFRNVTFRYGPTAPPVVEGLSFEVRPGEKVALVGPSGSGKSTVAKLLLGLVTPAEGEVLLDGQPLSELDLRAVRRQVGAVLQEATLFEGTLRENIALQHPTATLEEVAQAARIAQLHEDIQALPHGYETHVSAASAPLSGGQRQRLVLARAILHRPPLLVLDEATSALDAVTEAAVERYLASRSCTRIVIAHRLSTVKDADRILVLDRGKVVEQGRHDELMAARPEEGPPGTGLYARLVGLGEGGAAATTEQVTARREPPPDLSAFAALTPLGEAARAALAERLVRRVLAPGEELIRQGSTGAGLYLVVEGTLAVTVTEPGLPPLAVDELGPGQLLGEVGVLDGSSASATVTAATRAVLLHLPAGEVDRLRRARDPAALDLILALGALVCARLRVLTERRRATGHAGTAQAGDEAPTPSGSGTARAGATLRVEDTALGASLDPAELARLPALGGTRALARGETLFREGDPGDVSYLVLGGRIAVRVAQVAGDLNVLRPGELLGEVGFFDAGPRTASCVAVEPSVVLMLEHAALRTRLSEGDAMAWKALQHLVHAVVRSFRISSHRLREALARTRGELEAAARERHKAEALAESEEASSAEAAAEGRLPVVRDPEAATSGAACLAAILRQGGRGVTLAAVREATLERGVASASSLAAGARSLGLTLRRLSLDAADLVHVDAPLMVRLEPRAAATGGTAGAAVVGAEEANATEEARWVVVEACRRGRLLVMDPAVGRRTLAPADLEGRLGPCFEVRDSAAEGGGTSLGRRLLAQLGRRRLAVGGVVLSAVLLQLAALGLPLATGVLLERFVVSGDAALLGAVALGLAIVLVSQAALMLARGRALVFLRAHLDRGLLDGLMRQVLSLPIAFFEQHRPGEVLQRFESLRVLRQRLATAGALALLDGAFALLAWVALLALAPALALWPALALVALLGVTVWLWPRLGLAAATELAAGAAQKSRLIELCNGITTLRVSGAGPRLVERWFAELSRELDAGARQEGAVALSAALGELTRGAATLAVVVEGVGLVRAGELGLGPLVGGIALVGLFLGAVVALLGEAVALGRLAPRLRRLAETFTLAGEHDGRRVQPGRLRGAISLDGVSFRYSTEGAPALDGITLAIAPGSKVALVGPSGSGKSTLGKLLLGFHAPSSGRVLLDGRDLSSLDLPAVRAQFGVVLQDCFVFAGTLRDNLSVNAPGADLGRLKEAAAAAALDGEIRVLPMQYDTLVSEGGSSLSGGQRQRLGLARALVNEPAVLLLDEATSALDNLSQAAVEQNLRRLACTRIVVAHRLSTVVDADQIVVVERGRVVETGRHEELLARQGPYWRLFQAQLG